MSHDIILTVDYHDRVCVIRRRDCATRREQLLEEVPTSKDSLLQVVDEARRDAGRRGRVIWIQESTTGWARVKELLGPRVEFRLANVLQIPKTAKSHKRKTDKLDTGRIQREYINGDLPLAFQPQPELRQLRRVVAYREELVNRRTALRNWINRFLSHEAWYGQGATTTANFPENPATNRCVDHWPEARRTGTTGGTTQVGDQRTAGCASVLIGSPATGRDQGDQFGVIGVDFGPYWTGVPVQDR